MGIKNLHNFLRKTCPNVYQTVPISKYAFKKIAIDISIFMCKYKSTCGTSYLDSFLQLISVLRYNDVHFVFVYDSKPPPEKDNERRQRIENREKNKLRVEKIDQSWDHYKSKHGIQIEQVLENLDTIEDETLSQFLQKIADSEHVDVISCKKIEQEIAKLRNTILSIRTEDFNNTKDFFRACNIPFLDACGEAEATCSALNKKGLVAAVLTEDTDVLAYGTNFMLHRLDMSQNTFIEIDYEEILNQLKFTPKQFLDFCILCGTDYNSNMYKIGPEKAYKLLQQFKSIEGIQENNPNLPVQILNFEKVRCLFNPSIDGLEYIPYCGFPDKNSLERLYFINNCRYSLDRLYSSFHNSIFHDFEFRANEDQHNKANLLIGSQESST